MGIFEQYGIKEVADVTIYSIHKKEDGSGEVYYVPALYLDTLKVSSVEKTAENTWAQGGLGNSRLICWDYGKQINVTLEDALCTPASLGMCWGGVLSADWKDGHVEQDFGISFNRNPVEKISRMEKAFYPKSNKDKSSISHLLPQTKANLIDNRDAGIILQSDIVDGTKISGMGYIKNRIYTWKMNVESDIKSIAVVPNKFFDVNGKTYSINQQAAIGVNVPSQSDEIKIEVIYSINGNDGTGLTSPIGTSIVDITENFDNSTTEGTTEDLNLADAKFLKIRVDNNDNYYTYITEQDDPATAEWILTQKIDTLLFKGIDMWQRFDSVNEMIYFMLTKYENDISEIGSGKVILGRDENGNIINEGNSVGGGHELLENDEESIEIQAGMNKLWAYVNPKTMTPYPDDYWFHQGEPYFIKSLTFAPKGKQLKSKRIEVTAGQFPGMYMIVGETFIRERETGKDERMQIKFPLCKIKSDQNLTLEAEGDPTIFNLDIEVARPVNGIMMEITSYEIATKMIQTEDGYMEVKDGSTEVLSE